MIVYRLAKKKYCGDLSGEGAGLTGGRWNSRGIRVIYTSESRALCTAEIAVHIPIGILPDNYYLVTIEIPDNIQINSINLNTLPKNWNKFPYPVLTQDIGNRFIDENKYLVLRVPSAVIQGDFNYLLNPNHKDFVKIKITKKEKFSFDERLFK